MTNQHLLPEEVNRRQIHYGKFIMHLSPLMLGTMYRLPNGKFRKTGRRPSRWPFPYNNVLPLALRNEVSGKGDKQQNLACLHEMSILFACMKKNDFVQSLCSKEINSFQKCHLNFLQAQKLKKEQEREGNLVPYARNMSHRQVNQLLKQYPQPK
ncbi:hypothetical protein Pcinc_034317 [Petrolisthes cinctipes]|uniref:CHCH domain-containing protein n=1 Tax=Petrolisthes cinctipes TaxID=88211 RepID=A0AAE1EQJ2_PETCI|nr:hypothetical protein Pcinc_034317 [Petrolisthes cinctipes]